MERTLCRIKPKRMPNNLTQKGITQIEAEALIAEDAPAKLHKEQHQDGGADEISIAALSGEAADEQKSAWAKVSGKPTTFTPAEHATSHQDGGADEISIAALSGEAADEQKSAWAKVSGKPTTFTPAAHKANHEPGGSDEISTLNFIPGYKRSATTNARNFAQLIIKELPQVANWTTLYTITPSTVTSVWATGFVEAKLMGGINLVAPGARFSRWQYSIASGAPTVSVVGTDVTTGSSPQFQLTASGNNILIQVRGNGTNSCTGFIHLEIHCPDYIGVPNYTIT